MTSVTNVAQDSGYVLVMELCRTDLAEVLQRATQRLDEALVKGLMLQLLQGIAACHAAGDDCRCSLQRAMH